MVEAKDCISCKADAVRHFGADEFSLGLSARAGEATAQPTDSRRAMPMSRFPARSDFRMRRLATDVIAAVQSRLPGRIRDLKVRIDGEQVVLSGVSSSYYVKQVAQHIAMTALEAVTLGQIVNEIEVRAQR